MYISMLVNFKGYLNVNSETHFSTIDNNRNLGLRACTCHLSLASASCHRTGQSQCRAYRQSFGRLCQSPLCCGGVSNSQPCTDKYVECLTTDPSTPLSKNLSGAKLIFVVAIIFSCNKSWNLGPLQSWFSQRLSILNCINVTNQTPVNCFLCYCLVRLTLERHINLELRKMFNSL